MNHENPRPAYTAGEVAELFAVHPATVARWAEAGRIPFFLTPGGHRRYPREAVDTLVASWRAA